MITFLIKMLDIFYQGGYNMRVICDRCNRYVNHTLKENSEQLQDNHVIVTSLVCTRCKHRTIICVDDCKTMRYKTDITNLRKGINISRSAEQRERFINKIAYKKKQLKSRNEKLLAEYEKERNL